MRLAAEIGKPRADVSRAFLLGWHVAELYHSELPQTPDHDDATLPKRLPGPKDLRLAERAELLVQLIAADLSALSITEPGTADLTKALDGPTEVAQHLEKALNVLHRALLKKLVVQDFRLGRAYDMGRTLAETSLLPKWVETNPKLSFQAAFNKFRVLAISNNLRDLQSTLPSHAAQVVAANLAAWSDWVADPKLSGLPLRLDDASGNHKVDPSLRRQGDAWRSLLAGEKDATAALQLRHYFQAATDMVTKIGQMAVRFFFSPVGSIALAIVFVLVAVVVWLSFSSSSAVSGMVAALGGLGITGGSAAAAVKKALASAEKPMWEAELEASIAEANLVLPGRGRALARAQSTLNLEDASSA